MLTDAECRNAVCPPEKKRQRLACSGGLYLEISPGGSKRWFWKYRKISNHLKAQTISDSEVMRVTKLVNGGTHGLQNRIDMTKKIFEALNG